MKKSSILSLSLLVFLLMGCNKYLVKYNPEFEGTWKTIPVYDNQLNNFVQSELVFSGNEGSFKNACQPCGTDLCSCMNVQFGKVVINLSHDQIRIGSGNYPLMIEKEPYFQDTVWVMKIHGLTYYKQ